MNAPNSIPMPSLNQRIRMLVDELTKGNVAEFVQITHIKSHQNLNRIFNIDTRNGRYPGVSSEILTQIRQYLPNVSYDWLLTGEGGMFNAESESGIKFYNPEDAPHGQRRLVPYYDDVASIGGNIPGDPKEGGHAIHYPSEWIDPGDWFKEATGAIRHYGDSMVEYPPGCILALKEVKDLRLLVPGKDYVIQTSEYRVTKKIRLGNTADYIRAYSTNEKKYDDGSLIHQPFDIPLALIISIHEILGHVVKKGSGTMVFSHKNKM